MTSDDPRIRPALGALVLALFLGLIVRNAWVCDDAFITLRTVDNLLAGHGLRWNVAERVQTYTHPLWMAMLVVPHAIGGEPYYGTLAISWATSLAAVAALWFGVARGPWSALAACAPLLVSKAFVDFSTSGLENPLTHLWLALGVMSVARGGTGATDVARTATIAWSSALIRPDLPVLFAPLALVHVGRAGASRTTAAGVALGAIPLLAWELFSFAYYGALVPNTAYAKLGAGIARVELLEQGAYYLAYSTWSDAITPLAMAVAAAALLTRRTPEGLALLAGAAFYLGYVVWVGGDFMAGRFLTAPLFALMLGVARIEGRALSAGVAATGALLLAAPNPHAPLWSGAAYEKVDAWHGVVDERGYYHRGASLLASKAPISHGFAREGREARARGPHTALRATIGYFGYYAGPEVHVLDRLALGDPLLARLPARYDPTWRIGHFRRDVPAGYDPGTGAAPADPALAALWEEVRAVTRDPVLDPARWSRALRLMLAPPPIDAFAARFPDVEDLSPADPVLTGGRPRPVGPRGLRVPVDPPRPVHPRVEVDPGEAWRALYVRERTVLSDRPFVGPNARLRPSPGPVDAILLFPVVREGAQRVRAVDLTPRAR